MEIWIRKQYEKGQLESMLQQVGRSCFYKFRVVCDVLMSNNLPAIWKQHCVPQQLGFPSNPRFRAQGHFLPRTSLNKMKTFQLQKEKPWVAWQEKRHILEIRQSQCQGIVRRTKSDESKWFMRIYFESIFNSCMTICSRIPRRPTWNKEEGNKCSREFHHIFRGSVDYCRYKRRFRSMDLLSSSSSVGDGQEWVGQSIKRSTYALCKTFLCSTVCTFLCMYMVRYRYIIFQTARSYVTYEYIRRRDSR